MILDYSKYLKRSGAKGIESGKTRSKTIDIFYSNNEICPFCNVKTERVVYFDSGTIYTEWLDGSFREYEFVHECKICGWWEYQYENSSDAMLEFTRLREKKITTAILESFEVSDKQIPIKVLEDYLLRYPERVYDIHHKKMEELVQSVFSDFYDCNVNLVGKSADGGVDLIFVESDSPIVVQVKRRTKKDAVESASPIRDLLGATLLKDSKSCIFVSTADHFSPQAKQHAMDAVEKNIVERFDLFDYHKFIDMMNLTKNSNYKVWEKLLTVKKHV